MTIDSSSLFGGGDARLRFGRLTLSIPRLRELREQRRTNNSPYTQLQYQLNRSSLEWDRLQSVGGMNGGLVHIEDRLTSFPFGVVSI
jgi:hypothetical protein